MKFFWIVFLLVLFVGCANPEPHHKEIREISAPQNNVEIPNKEPVLLGEWQTQIINQEEARVHNITLAVSVLHGVMLAPGESFSFNTLLGERTEEKGYQSADIFVGDETEKAVGGGICQVSSTLYMAVKNAGLSVTERHAHSQSVAYAAEGEDACVSFGTLDFCFVNTRQKPIQLMAATDGASVSLQLWEIQ